MDVVIIGAGNAGLAALHTLRKQGVDAVCLEAKNMAGGRTITVNKNGYLFDFGSQFLFKFNHRFFDLCRDMGMGDDITPWAGTVFFYKNGQMLPAMVGATPKVLWQNRARLKGMHKVLAPKAAFQLLKMAPLIAAKVRAGGLDFVDYQASLDMDHESFSETCLRLAGREVLEGLFQPNLSAMTLGMPEEVSAPYGLALFWQSSQGYWTLKHGIG
ncbi:MAG: FAD-dependent oxidoreductase, partial [Syntrophaceae bacterium]